MSVFNYLLRVFFRLLYHEFAWSYDWVAAIVSLGNWKRWVLAVLPYLGEGTVLEVGHGPGHLQTALLEQKRAAFGLDASLQMGRQAMRRLRRAGFRPRLARAYAQESPFPGCTFETIVATFPSEYIVDTYSLQEFWRVLAPGGCLVVLPFAWITGNRLIDQVAGWLFDVTRQSPEFPVPDARSGQGELKNVDIKELGPWFRKFGQSAEGIGFQLRCMLLEQDTSVLVLVIAEKPDQLQAA